MDLIKDIQLFSTSSEFCYCYYQSVPVFIVSLESIPVCSHSLSKCFCRIFAEFKFKIKYSFQSNHSVLYMKLKLKKCQIKTLLSLKYYFYIMHINTTRGSVLFT